jgi:hypothetical protein
MSSISPLCDFVGVLSRADSDALGRLLRPEACRLIQQLDATLYYPAQLCMLVLELRPAFDLLSDLSARNMILELLRPEDLGNHLKTGHTLSLQNRPTG